MKQRAAATERNSQPIRACLSSIVPDHGHILEIASGTGQHAVAFAEAFPTLTWQPSDLAPESLASVSAWARDRGGPNLRTPLRLDVLAETWPTLAADGIVCINMIHIAPWAATEGLFRHAAAVLRPARPGERRGWLYLYGPFFVDGETPVPSNVAFDISLRERNPSWGVRNLSEVAAVAAQHGFDLEQKVGMPANNLSLIFRLRGSFRNG